ncbi:MAG: aldolase [Alphaproteobacteria bacterium CG11_big_fil_rev_8_21_14_0_20_44_7]|nr:MAG: aldolase [Alphaproteobacteria bacterium CG11_big_fil_rev_8_21_14_0_20_44_7]
MGFFNKREKANEDKYARDEETQFKVRAKMSGLLALWAAEKMGKSSEAAANYADAVVSKMYSESNLFEKIKTDLLDADVHASDEEIRAKMEELTHISRIDLGAVKEGSEE